MRKSEEWSSASWQDAAEREEGVMEVGVYAREAELIDRREHSVRRLSESVLDGCGANAVTFRSERSPFQAGSMSQCGASVWQARTGQCSAATRGRGR